jgi:hypothetical protein
MGAGLLAVKSRFILFIKSYQFPLQINTLERERETIPESVTTFGFRSRMKTKSKGSRYPKSGVTEYSLLQDKEFVYLFIIGATGKIYFLMNILMTT